MEEIDIGYPTELSHAGALPTLYNRMENVNTQKENINLMPCVSLLSKFPLDHKISAPYLLYESDSMMRLPLQKAFLSQNHFFSLFWKLTFKLSGNSASFCFAFRSCFVSSGSVIGSFTSSLLSRKEQMSWVTFSNDCVASFLYREHRFRQELHTVASCQRPKQRDRLLGSCLSFSLSSPFQATLFIHRTNMPCIWESYSAVASFVHGSSALGKCKTSEL